MTYSVGQDQTASVKSGLRLLPLYFNNKADMSGKTLQQTTSADNFLDAFSEQSKGMAENLKQSIDFVYACLDKFSVELVLRCK